MRYIKSKSILKIIRISMMSILKLDRE